MPKMKITRKAYDQLVRDEMEQLAQVREGEKRLKQIRRMINKVEPENGKKRMGRPPKIMRVFGKGKL